MSIKARVMARMYAKGTITNAGLRRAVADGTITAAEYETITGEVWVSDELE